MHLAALLVQAQRGLLDRAPIYLAAVVEQAGVRALAGWLRDGGRAQPLDRLGRLRTTKQHKKFEQATHNRARNVEPFTSPAGCIIAWSNTQPKTNARERRPVISISTAAFPGPGAPAGRPPPACRRPTGRWRRSPPGRRGARRPTGRARRSGRPTRSAPLPRPGRTTPVLVLKRPARPYRTAIAISLRWKTLRPLTRPCRARTVRVAGVGGVAVGAVEVVRLAAVPVAAIGLALRNLDPKERSI